MIRDNMRDAPKRFSLFDNSGIEEEYRKMAAIGWMLGKDRGAVIDKLVYKRSQPRDAVFRVVPQWGAIGKGEGGTHWRMITEWEKMIPPNWHLIYAGGGYAIYCSEGGGDTPLPPDGRLRFHSFSDYWYSTLFSFLMVIFIPGYTLLTKFYDYDLGMAAFTIIVFLVPIVIGAIVFLAAIYYKARSYYVRGEEPSPTAKGLLALFGKRSTFAVGMALGGLLTIIAFGILAAAST